MQIKYKILIITVSLTAAFAGGRLSTPVKIKTVIQTVEVEKKQSNTDTDSNQDKHKETVVKEVVKPDGEKETTTTTTEDTTLHKNTNTSTTDQTDISQTQSKEIIKDSNSKVTISGLVGVNALNVSKGLDFGVSISKPILGPIAIGLFGLKSGTVGFSLGIGI